MSVALKSQKKVNQEQASDFEKEASKLRKTIIELSEFKNSIVEEAKKEKKLKKKLSKKLKQAALKELKTTMNDKKTDESIEVEFEAEDQENEFVKQECETTIDNQNNQQLEQSESVELKSTQTKPFDFPEKFKDWSEEQRKEAHENNFKFYVEKYLDGLNL